MRDQAGSKRQWWQPALVGLSPLFVLAFIILGIIASMSLARVIESVLAVMAAGFAALLVSARLMYDKFRLPRLVSWFYGAAASAVMAGWVWQRAVFDRLIPNRFLEYGYFLKPAGRHARHALLEVPGVTVTSALGLLLVLALWASWRAGARGSVLPLIGWWFTLLVLFGLPYFYWSLQGDAAIFI